MTTSKEIDNKQYKAFWRRTIALFLDGAALSPLIWLDRILWNIDNSTFLLFLWTVLYSIIAIAYSVGFVYFLGQTPGKIATGIIILSKDGSRLNLKQAILRHIVPIIFTPITIVIVTANLIDGKILNRGIGSYVCFIWIGIIAISWGMLEIITMLTNSKRRAIHDFIAGTIVIKQPVESRIVGHKKILWILITLYILNILIPKYLPEEKNITFGKSQLYQQTPKKFANWVVPSAITPQA